MRNRCPHPHCILLVVIGCDLVEHDAACLVVRERANCLPGGGRSHSPRPLPPTWTAPPVAATGVCRREACLRDADRALSEFSRVLRPGGQLLQITFAQPHFRRRYLDKPKYGWRLLPHETVQEGLGYFFYVVVKHGGGVGSSSALPVGGAAVAVEVPAEEGKEGGAGSPAPAPEGEFEFVAGVCKDQSTVPGRAGADGIAQPHPPRCECGCIPAGIPSLFEMAALRKAHAARKAREGASESVSE